MPVVGMKHIVLCHVSQDPGRLLKCFGRSSRPVQWIFFGSDYIQQTRWQDALPGEFCRVGISEGLQKAVEHLGGLFRDLITDLSQVYSSPAWWASRVAERNSLVSPLFLYCCYLHIWQEYSKAQQGDFCIISEDWALLESIAQSVGSMGFTVEWAGKKSPLLRKIQCWFKASGRVVKFLIRSFMAGFAGPGRGLSDVKKKTILMHTYVDEGCFKPDGNFSDRYFPGLGEWLEKQGVCVVIIPALFNVKRSYQNAWQWFRKSRHNFLNPYSLYRPSDYVFALRESWRQRRMPEGNLVLGDMNVSGLFMAERDRYLFGCLDTLLYYRLPKRLQQQGLEISRVIEVFENMIDEKMLISGFRKYSPSTCMVGFQHSALFPAFVCSYISQREARIAPLPDKVVCCGQLFYDVLRREGFPEDRLVVGPALRYKYLWEKKPYHDAQGTSGDILIVLPLTDSDAVELLTKSLGAFDKEQALRIFVKPHPMARVEKFMASHFPQGLPRHFQIVKGDMAEWLSKIKVVVAMSSSSSLEVVAAGKPVIVVGRESAIDLNPLGFLEGFNRVFVSTEDIRATALDFLGSIEARRRYEVFGKELIEKVFQPISEESMKVFI